MTFGEFIKNAKRISPGCLNNAESLTLRLHGGKCFSEVNPSGSDQHFREQVPGGAEGFVGVDGFIAGPIAEIAARLPEDDRERPAVVWVHDGVQHELEAAGSHQGMAVGVGPADAVLGGSEDPLPGRLAAGGLEAGGIGEGDDAARQAWSGTDPAASAVQKHPVPSAA